MLEELTGGALRVIGRVLFGAVVEFLWFVLCHLVGWVFLRAVTLGRYPPHGLFSDRDSGAAEGVGLLVIAGGVALAYLLLGT